MYRKPIITVGIFLLLAMLAIPVLAGDADIIISEILVRPNNTAGNAEWVEIYNKGTIAVDLTGWQICDNASCDQIPSGTIGAGEYWLITSAADAATLQAEFNTYTNTPTVIPAQTIFIGGDLGNQLGNTDQLEIWTPMLTAASDCVSWYNPATTDCATLTPYLPGSDGTDTSLGGTINPPYQGQTFINIQGDWCYAVDDAPTPYVDNSEASGGGCANPTAISLNDAGASQRFAPVWLGLLGLVFVSGGLLIRRRQ